MHVLERRLHQLPRILVHQGGQQVIDNHVGTLFRATATFSTSQRGRAMEYAIAWNTFFLATEGLGTVKTWIRRGMDNLRKCLEHCMGAAR